MKVQNLLKKLWSIIRILYEHVFLGLPALVCSLLTKPFIHDLWLIYEDGNHAQDNGYWFFKYVREQHPEQKTVFVINKKSQDYNKVKCLGKTCGYRSFMHWYYYFVCSKDISTHPHYKPTRFKCLWINKTYFLQHGVIRDYVGYMAKDINLKLFITSAYEEDKFIKDNFGFKDGIVQLLGLARHDNLLDYTVDPKQILIMPTWRNYISSMNNSEFVESDYYKHWAAVLNNPELFKLLEERNMHVVFYPHRNMQKFVDVFEGNEKVIIADTKNYDIQTLLKESALLITDYSSVFFDFAYMKKPVIWFHFDEDTYWGTHHVRGYFKEENSPLGEKVTEVGQLIATVKKNINNQFVLDAKRIDGIENFFKYFDGKNCERNYNAIKEIK